MVSKKNQDPKADYAAEIKKLRQNGAAQLYLLYGPEDYLRDQYLVQLKQTCLPEGEDEFSFKRINGPLLDSRELMLAIDSPPFLSERSVIELRDIDINKLPDQDGFVKILSDMPDYCTVVFVLDSEYEPDKRLKLYKFLKTKSEVIFFAEQDQGKLLKWISRRFDAYGKSIDLEAARRLIFLCGELMSKLIPEIEKIAAYTAGDKVTVVDVNDIAVPVPDAAVYQLTQFISEKRFNNAFDILQDLLSQDNEPIAILAMLGMHMRRMYAAKLALTYRLGTAYLSDLFGLRDYAARQIMKTADNFTLSQLERAIISCAEADYLLKNSGGAAGAQILTDVLLKFAAGL